MLLPAGVWDVDNVLEATYAAEGQVPSDYKPYTLNIEVQDELGVLNQVRPEQSESGVRHERGAASHLIDFRVSAPFLLAPPSTEEREARYAGATASCTQKEGGREESARGWHVAAAKTDAVVVVVDC